MTSRRFNLPNNVTAVKACPVCGQKTQFVAKSQQVREDGCEVWIECVCGYDPHKFNERLESVTGGCDPENILAAIDCWNAASGHHPPAPAFTEVSVGDKIKVAFSGGIEGETTGVVTAVREPGPVAFRCDAPWRDTLGGHDHEAGSEHLAHMREVRRCAGETPTTKQND